MNFAICIYNIDPQSPWVVK